MKMFLNGEEFYYRLRDLLQTNDDINNYKFNNKYHAFTKDFDVFLQNTVRKYMDAYNKITFIKEEKEELTIENTVLKQKVHTLSQILAEKDAIIKGIELLIKQKDQVINEVKIAQREKNTKGQAQRSQQKPNSKKSQEIEDTTSRIEEAKVENTKNEEKIAQLLVEIQTIKSENDKKVQMLMLQNRKRFQQAVKIMQEQHRRETKELKFINQEKISSLKDQIWFLQKKCEQWAQKYKKEVGFNLLCENE